MTSPTDPRAGRPLMLASPEECERSFYEALEAGDAEAVADLWLDDDDVCCVHPNGPRLIGHAQVRASFNAILSGGPLQVRMVSRKALETPTVATSSVIEEIAVRRGRAQEVVHVIATNVFVKTGAGWKLVLHHASPAPEGQPQELEVPQGPLH